MPLGKKNADYFNIFSASFAFLARANSAVQGRAFLHGSCSVQSTGNVTAAQSEVPLPFLEETGTHICAFGRASK